MSGTANPLVEAVTDHAASSVHHGRSAEGARYAHERVGHNRRMTSLAAAINNLGSSGWDRSKATSILGADGTFTK